MDSKKLEEHSRNTKKQVDFLLQSTKILDILEKFGKPHLIGSYPLDTMYGPDLDIIVESETTRESALDALQEVLEKRIFRKVEFGDFVKFPMNGRPSGYILVLKSVVEGVNWEIEVWFLEDVLPQLNKLKLLKSKISQQDRIKILEAKHLRDSSKTSQDLLESIDIYERILGSVTNLT